MPVYCFFKKGEHVNALERDDTKGAACLREWGYSRQPEEIDAANTHRALIRFIDIRNEEQSGTHAFSSGVAFVTLITGTIALIDWFFFK